MANGNHENGMTYATLIVAVVSAITLILVITFFLWVIQKMNSEHSQSVQQMGAASRIELDNSETRNAYRFTWIKNKFNVMKQKCDEKLQRNADWEKWSKERGVKAPFELTRSAGDCLIDETEMPEPAITPATE